MALNAARHFPTVELFTARVRYRGEKPAEVRIISQLTKTKLATLTGTASGGRSVAENKS